MSAPEPDESRMSPRVGPGHRRMALAPGVPPVWPEGSPFPPKALHRPRAGGWMPTDGLVHAVLDHHRRVGRGPRRAATLHCRGARCAGPPAPAARNGRAGTPPACRRRSAPTACAARARPSAWPGNGPRRDRSRRWPGPAVRVRRERRGAVSPYVLPTEIARPRTEAPPPPGPQPRVAPPWIPREGSLRPTRSGAITRSSRP